MSYSIFIIGFATAGFGLLAWLLVRNLVAAQRSAMNLAPLKAAGKRVDSDLKSMKAAGADLKEGVSIAEEMRRRIRRAAAMTGERVARVREEETRSEAEGVRAEREDLDTYWRVVRLLHQTFVPEGLEELEFPVRAYARADAATKRSVGLLMIVLRSEREGAKMGLSDEA
jgi:hypothetical protein